MSARTILPLAALLLAACQTSAALAPMASADQVTPPPAKKGAQACEDWDEWDKAGPPYQVYGNTYYVGTCGIAAILVTGHEGHVLIDGGSRGGAPLIAANIEELGFSLSDVKILLHSHEHFDHVGGLAELQHMTGARLLASEAAAPVLTSGEAAADDPQAGMHDPFKAARVDGTVEPGRPITLGALSLTPIATPGHTAGALSWTWTSCEGGPASVDCRAMVYADSLSPVSADDYRFSDHPEWITAYHAGLERLREVRCDILMTPHPSASQMRARIAGAAPMTCKAYADAIHEKLDQRLEKERASS
jgi:metallo-beta-lactamase class B